MELLEHLTATGKIDLLDPMSIETGLSDAMSEIRSLASDHGHLHGFRAQRMFSYVAASLGQVAMVKEEDAGFLYSADELATPDFRLVLKSGSQFLVECKNFGHMPFHSAPSWKADYVSKLKAYSNLVGLPLRVAVYWYRAGVWTLNDLSDFALDPNQGRYKLELETAAKRNMMAELGDLHLGTEPPLTFRLLSQKGSRIKSDGKTQFRVNKVELTANGRLISKEAERKIATFLMFYGKWNMQDQAIVKNGLCFGLEYVFQPEELAPNQNFQLVDSLSSMISRAYRAATASEAGVKKLRPNWLPNAIGLRIPDNYRGEALKLWIIQQQPNYE